MPLFIGMVLTTAGLIFAFVGAMMSAHAGRPAAGAETLIGSDAVVVKWKGNEGSVRLQGEVWTARSDEALQPKETVKVIGRDGMLLVVEPLREACHVA